MIKKISQLKKASEAAPLPSQVAEAFTATGNAQRGAAEDAMRKVIDAFGGGVLPYVVEHTGDLLHRMTHMVGWYSNEANPHRTGYEYVKTKVRTVLSDLTDNFRWEMMTNIENNASYHNKSPKEMLDKIKIRLQQYGEEHEKLKVYNRAQWLARKACMLLGMGEFESAVTPLKELQSHLGSPEEWDSFAAQYELNPDGTVKEYRQAGSTF